MQNRQAQQTLNARRNTWQTTLQNIKEKHQQESVGQETSSFDDQLTQSGNDYSQNSIPNGINGISNEDNKR